MENLIKANYNKALSGNDIFDRCHKKVNILIYNDLKKMTNYKQLFDKFDACVLLYQTSENYGHWVTLLLKPDHIEFFDPYASKLDSPLDISNPLGFRPELTRLLLDYQNLTNGNVIYLKTPLQKLNDNIQTCGRHSIVRVLMKDLSLSDYVDLFKKQPKSPDYYVTALTLLS